MYDQVDSGKYILSPLFDLSKAFDSVDKKYLDGKLCSLGLYMSNRNLKVQVGETKSSQMNNDLRVTQGSVLGPL